ncbi:MAG TPA: acyl-CoA dehydrogenase family protein, partial [Acidimicrobiales bacterium]|nr:acyl-CoA dehydrogenase family protein [Acidimicrobiales bacterium]
MRLQWDDDAEAFRRELDDWLDANLPPADKMREPKRSSAHLPDWARDWQRTLYEAGWLVPGWPPELGGRNATPVQQMIYFEELAKRDVPRSLNPQGLSICAASIVDYGTDEQKERWVLPTLRADITWCLGMSEPGAGSDLAGLSTRAVLDGDNFVVNGQKVWTSGAHDADWCLCFVRTDPDVPKHKGISALVIDMRTPGITCRPLPELTDPEYADFNEVFFSDVVVPRENLLGELNR